MEVTGDFRKRSTQQKADHSGQRARGDGVGGVNWSDGGRRGWAVGGGGEGRINVGVRMGARVVVVVDVSF